jgi:hypothetical protein
MKQSPSWEANSYSDLQKIPRLLQNHKVVYCVYTSPLQGRTLSQRNPLHTLEYNVYKIYFNIILPPTLSFPIASSHFLRAKMFMRFSFKSACYITRHRTYFISVTLMMSIHNINTPNCFWDESRGWTDIRNDVSIIRLFYSPCCTHYS